VSALDPLGFTIEALAARGALVEQAPGATLAILPAALAESLALDEEVRLTLDPDGRGAVSCGLGAPLLERLIGEARARVPVAWTRLDVEPPSASRARAAAEHFVVRNGLAEVTTVGFAETSYVLAAFAWVVEADDRYEGMLTVAMEASGGVPDAAFMALLDPLTSPSRLQRSDAAPVPAGAAQRLARRASRAVPDAIDPIRGSVARRQAREHGRIAEYFASMVAESRAPRRAIDPKTIAARVAQLVGERDSKLRDLAERYALRVRLEPAAFVWARARVAEIALRVKRRKGTRELAVRLAPGAKALDQLACEGCAGATAQPVLCDDRLHVLCESCAPSAQGRPACAACTPRKRQDV
jgi:hypothetical protein